MENIKDNKNNIFITLYDDKLKDDDSLKVAIGDNFAIKDEKMTAGSFGMENFYPPYSATVVELINEENNIEIIGKTNLDEFQIQSNLEKPYYGENGNIFSDTYIENASFSSSLSIREGFSDISIVSDMDGDARINSSYLNLIGYKPTYGLISRYGVTQCFNSFEQPGVISKNIANLCKILNILVKKDEKDLNSIDYDMDIENNSNLNEYKIGIPMEIYELIKSNEIKKEFDDFIKLLEKNNILVEKFESNIFEESLKSYTILSNTELSSNMMKYTGLIFGHRVEDYDNIFDMYSKSRRESFGLDLISRIILGVNYVTGDKNKNIYNVAYKNRVSIKSKLNEYLDKFDFILTPATPYNLKDSNLEIDLEKILFNKIFTSLANLCEIPAITLPMKKDEENPTLGIQLISKRLNDNNLIKLAKRIEEII